MSLHASPIALRHVSASLSAEAPEVTFREAVDRALVRQERKKLVLRLPEESINLAAAFLEEDFEGLGLLDFC